MTTVVAHVPSMTMTADRRVTVGDGVLGDMTKIVRRRGCLFGFCGDVARVPETIAAFLSGKPVRDTGVELLVLRPDGAIWHVDGCGRGSPIESPWCAIGSGSQFALGALDAGSTPKQALQIAHGRDAKTGSRINSLKLKRKSHVK